MYKDHKISVVIPCRNESEGIKNVLNAIPGFVDEVIVVDNNSSDNTSEVAIKHGAVVIQDSNIGYGSACQTGFNNAKGDLIVTLDGDGQYDPNEISVLLDALIAQGKGMVVGDRIPGFRKPSYLKWLRFIGNVFLSTVSKILFGPEINDSQSGMWVLYKIDLNRIKFHYNDWAFAQEIKIKFNYFTSYQEVPISYKARLGESKLSWLNDGLGNLCSLFKIYWEINKGSKVFYKIVILASYIFVLASFAWVIFSQPYLPGGDDLYFHIKYSYLYRIMDWGEIQKFPWLQYTFPNNYFVDLWWLFHLFELPFTYFSNLLLAAKFSIITFVSLLVIIFVTTLRTFRIRFRLFWLLLLFFGSQHFLFRLSLGRPLIFNIIFVLLTFIVLYKRRYVWIMPLAILFLLNNVAAFLMLPIISIFIFVESIRNHKIVWRPLVYLLVGYLFGFLLNPFFPQHLNLAFVQIYHPQITAVLDHISVGSELYPYSYIEYLNINGIVLIIWLIATIAWFKHRLYKIDKNKDGWWILLVSLLTLVMSLKSKRYIEYSIPVMVIFIAYVSKFYSHHFNFKNIKDKLKFGEFKISVIVFLLLFASIFAFNIANIYTSIRNSPQIENFKNASLWLRENTNKGDIIFNTQWDQFPQLFFWNSENYYIVGIEPTFMYVREPGLYNNWQLLNNEDFQEWESIEKLHNIIAIEFKASYLFIENARNPLLLNYIESNDLEAKYFHKAYQDDVFTIFELK